MSAHSHTLQFLAEAEAEIDRLTETAAQLRTEQAATASQLATLVEASIPADGRSLWSHSIHCASEMTWKATCDCGLGERRATFRLALSDLATTAKAHDERIRAEERERLRTVWLVVRDQGGEVMAAHADEASAYDDLHAREQVPPFGRYRIERWHTQSALLTPSESATPAPATSENPQ